MTALFIAMIIPGASVEFLAAVLDFERFRSFKNIFQCFGPYHCFVWVHVFFSILSVISITNAGFCGSVNCVNE